MRDEWYDERLGNRDWPTIRRKYTRHGGGRRPIAEAFTTVVQLMLGELNGSHLGFYPPGSPGFAPLRSSVGGDDLRDVVRDDRPSGRALPVRLPGSGLEGPRRAARRSRRPEKEPAQAGEMILKIDETAVDPSMDLTRVLNGPGRAT